MAGRDKSGVEGKYEWVIDAELLWSDVVPVVADQC